MTEIERRDAAQFLQDATLYHFGTLTSKLGYGKIMVIHQMKSLRSLRSQS